MTGCIEFEEVVMVSERVEANEYPGGGMLRWAQGHSGLQSPGFLSSSLPRTLL